jgi:phosphatidate cytidylyltransferase
VIHANILWIAIAIFVVLAIGTAVRLGLRGPQRDDLAKRQLGSLCTWWVIAALIVACTVAGLGVAVLLFAAVSVLALREFFWLVPAAREDRGLVLAAYLLVAIHYGLIWADGLSVFVFLPLSGLLLFSSRLLWLGRTEGYVQSLASLHWGLLLTAYCLAHAVLLFTLPANANPVGGGAGWFLYLMILSQGNDIMQALVGRRWGRRKLAPRISPRKSLEGLLGGVVATALLAVLLAPWLTPFAPLAGLAAGLLIAGSGVLGDLNMSAVKRQAGVAESGDLLPGQGGILDRIDSLTFAAPTFYYFAILTG